MRNKVYLFLDWSMTINKLVLNNRINAKLFNSFFKALCNLEKRHNCNLRLVIVSGCSHNKAIKRWELTFNAFKSKKRDNLFAGFAYEYGGRFIDEYKNDQTVLDFPMSKETSESLDELARRHGVSDVYDYKLYCGYETELFDENFENFIKQAKQKHKELDVIEFNDECGIGVDFKNRDVCKRNFVDWFLKSCKNELPSCIVVGGDDLEDFNMLSSSIDCRKIFIGFEKFGNYESIISESENVYGIIESLNKIQPV